jgi:hypothetical protein
MASQDKIPLVALYAYASPAGYKSNPLYYTASFPTITECVLGTDKWFIDQWKGSRRPKIAALAADFPSFRSLEYLQKNPDTVKKLGGDWVGLEWMPPTPIDLRVQIGRLVDAGADLISLQGTLAHAKVVAMNVAQLNIDTKKVAIALAPAGTDENVVKFLGEQGEGFYGEVATVSADADVPGNKLVKEIMAARGRPAAKNVYHYRAGIALAHAPVAAIKAALEKVGYDKLTSTDIRNALFTLKNVDTGGLMPPMTVRESDYPVLTNHYRMTRIQGGRLVSVSGFYELGRLPEARW